MVDGILRLLAPLMATRSTTVSLGLWAACALVALGFALRVYNLAGFGLWFDDTHSIHMARLPLAQMVAEVAQDIHPPLYFALLGLWRQLAGESEFAYRFFTVLTAVPATPLLYQLGRRLSGEGAGLLTALLLTLSPLLVYYSQDVRMYTPAISLAVALAYFGWRALEGEPRRRWLWQYALAGAASGYTLLFGWAVLAVTNAAFILQLWQGRGAAVVASRRLDLVGWLAAQLAVLALMLPWLPVMQSKQLVGAAGDWQPLAGLGEALNAVYGAFSYGFSPAPGAHYLGAEALWLVAAVGLPLVAVLYWRRRAVSQEARALLFGALWLVVAFVFVYLALAGRRDIALRYLMMAFPGFALLVGGTLALALRRRSLLVLAAVVVGLGLAQPLYDYYEDPARMRPGDRAALQDLQEMARPGDGVVFNAHYHTVSYEYYGDPAYPAYGLPTAEYAARKADDRSMGVATGRALEQIGAKHERLWVVYWTEYFADPDAVVERWLDSNWVRFSSGVYNGWLRLKGYERRPPEANTLGGAIQLAAYELTPQPLVAGHTATVKLSWRTVAKPAGDYQVFVHLLDASGRLVAQHDGPPDKGKSRTSEWLPGTRVEEVHDLSMPAEAVPGEYRLIAGFYELETMQRLRTAADDHIVVAQPRLVVAP